MTEPPVRAGLADRYRIERELGAGGMATVYLAHDLKHDRQVAIKVLRPELAASLGHERFLREIATTASLRHPHILPLFDSGEADGLLFYVMPYVEGETLRDRLEREKQLPVEDATRIARDVADALDYAHRHGVIHRDIKPENILLEGGHAVVADFGIARAVRAAGLTTLTQTGTAIGTPAYMSPEQAAGDQEVDGRSDQYGLACVLFEMLAGQPPFTGATVESVLHQHLAAVPRRVADLRSTVPPSFDDALRRALAKSPADRFVTTTAFIEALRDDAAPRAATRFRLRRVVFTALSLTAAAALAAVAIPRWSGDRGDAGLDANVIAVLPFRVGGPNIDYLRESMLDLLQARLGSDEGARTVEPRTTLAAWRSMIGNENEDLSEQDSRTLARRLGAGRVLLGSAVATPTELTLTGTLRQVSDGATLARESVVGAPDSVAFLVNRLTSALLIGESGEGRERQAGLAAAPLDALQDYLAGRKAARRGDYFDAMKLFERAFVRDSTFVAAAFAMVANNAWIGTVYTTAGVELIPFVSRERDRLNARDRGLFLALPMVGPRYPQPSTYAEVIAQAERAANDAADSPEHWLLLGQVLSHYGAVASQQDWLAGSAMALDRAIALDSSFAIAYSERLFTSTLADDREATARVTPLFEARVTSGFADDMMLWAAALTTGDSALAARWWSRREGLSPIDYAQKLTKIPLHSAAFALPLRDARHAVQALTREASTPAERNGAILVDLAVRFAEGSELQPGFDVDAYGPGWASTLIQQATIEPAYRAIADSIIARDRWTAQWPPVQLCSATLHRVATGDTLDARDAIRRLRTFEATDPPPVPLDVWQALDFRVCPLLLEVLLDPVPPRGEPWPRLDELDAIMRDGPRWFAGEVIASPNAFANFTVARLRDAQGDAVAALAAIRRREVDYFPPYLWSLPAFLRQEGRLAARTGDVAGAIDAYDRYLTLRTDPMPSLRPQRDSVLAERAVLGTARGR